MKVLCEIDTATPISYYDVFEPGDIWLKIVGCDNCSNENRKKCCKDCQEYTDIGCGHHSNNNGQEKPFVCVVAPTPKSRIPYCQIKFECVKGKDKGNIIKMNREAK